MVQFLTENRLMNNVFQTFLSKMDLTEKSSSSVSPLGPDPTASQKAPVIRHTMESLQALESQVTEREEETVDLPMTKSATWLRIPN